MGALRRAFDPLSVSPSSDHGHAGNDTAHYDDGIVLQSSYFRNDPPRPFSVHRCCKPLDLTHTGISAMLKSLGYCNTSTTAPHDDQAISASTGLEQGQNLQDKDRVNSSRALWKAIGEGQASALVRWTLGPLLTTLSYPYDWAHQLRLQAYHLRWAGVRQLPCHVISIGNLTLGGTGKTPVVELVADLLRREGMRACVLSRGYGGRPKSAITIVSDGQRCLVPPEVAGDEPVLLAEHLVGLPVVVGKDRYAAGMLAIERFGVEVIVLDDGFQHVQLARDLNILLLDAVRPFGNGRLFPRGELRERPTGMARADAIVLTRWDAEAATSLTARQLVQSALPLFCSQHEPVDLRTLAEGHLLPLASLKGQRILGFCGIGMPDHFRQMLQRLEAEIIAFAEFPDHHPFTRLEIEQLVLMAKQHGTEILVTTEKDGVRLRGLQPLTAQVWELRIRATIVAQEADWKRCILGNLKA
jgi:tetraacyldisaccharide 4'-kinase